MNNKKILKFLTVGAASFLSCSIALAANKIQVIPNGFISDKVIEKASKINIENISPDSPIVLNIIDRNNISEIGNEADVNLVNQTCTINVNVTDNFISSDLGSGQKNKIIGNSLKLDNQNQEELRTEFSIYHEAAHCDMYKMKKPFVLNNKLLESTLNQYYQYAGSVSDGQKTYSGIYQTLQENYADALAAIMLIKNHGTTPDVLKVIKVVSLERQEVGQTYMKYGSDSHISNYTLDQILAPNTLKEIAKNENIMELKQVARKIANDGTMVAINTYSNPGLVYSIDTIASGIFTLTVKQLYGQIRKKDNNENKMGLGDKVLYIESTKVLEKLSQIKDLGKLKSDTDIYNFVNKNAQLIGDLSLAQAQILISLENKKGNHVLVDVSSIKNEFSKAKINNYLSISELGKNSTKDSVFLSELVNNNKIDDKIKNEANSASLRSGNKP